MNYAGAVRNPVRALLWSVGVVLSWAGVIDRQRAARTTELAWPRVVTGMARMSKSAADLAMVGVAVGTTAMAGIGFAAPFAFLTGTIGGGIAGGTISLVSQRFGAEAYDELDLVVKQSVWVTVLVCLPFLVAFLLFPRSLIGLVASDPESLHYGAVYLQTISVGVVFVALNLIASRALVGADDSYTPMLIRGGGAVLNVAFNAVFIFGLEWGVAGAAAGTVLANGLVTATFAYGFVGGHVPYVGRFPVTVTLSGPYVDRALVHDLVEISTPVVFTQLAWVGAQFPMIAIVGLFGPEIVAAYVVALRVAGLMNTPSWGFGLASSSLVGQELGRSDEPLAEAYGREIVVFAVAVHALLAGFAFVFATPIGRLFVGDSTTLPMVAVFIQVAAVSVVWGGLHGAAEGPLVASGDTRWPFYARITGQYLVSLPVAYLGAVTALGIVGLYAAMVLASLVPALVVLHRFVTGRWKAVSRSYRPVAPAD